MSPHPPLLDSLPDLPVREVIPDLLEALATEGSAVLVAPPGAGKTTLVPLALLGAEWLAGRKVIVLEPRRLAARAAAHRMAHLLRGGGRGGQGAEPLVGPNTGGGEGRRHGTAHGEGRSAELQGEGGVDHGEVGGTVGYRIRADTRVSPRTRIEVVTEGVLTRMLLSDPGLSGVGAILFDEFHERSLPADLGLALSLQSRSLLRPDLRLLVMSATLEAEPVARLLGMKGGDAAGGGAEGGGTEGRGSRGGGTEGGGTAGSPAPILRSEGRSFPVETRWMDGRVDRRVEAQIGARVEDAAARTVRDALAHEEGDILVFLPGAGEIRRVAERLDGDGALPTGVELFPLHGALPREVQDRAIAPSPPGRRKVVLASAVAETSLTIEGVRIVVDGGLMRIPRFDPGTGMTRLATVRVTRDSADQRRGRAGRTGPGVCYRLWTRDEDRGLVATRTPEILEADLAPLALELAAWGAEPEELAWLDPPPASAFSQARELLRELELLDGHGALTPHGREVVELAVHPRIGHMLLRGKAMGLGGLAAEVAALLGERDILFREGAPAEADLRLRIEALRRGGGWAPGGHRVDRGALHRIRDEADRRRRALGAAAPAPHHLNETGVLLALAYPDRVGRSRAGGGGRFLLRSGRGARVGGSHRGVGASPLPAGAPDPLAREEWIVAAEVEASGADARVFRGAPVTGEEVERLFADEVAERDEVVWDDNTGRVVARRVRRLGAIVLTEKPLPDPDPDTIARALLTGIRGRGLHLLPWGKDEEQLRRRLHFLHHLDPQSFPDASEDGLLATLESWLLPFLSGVRSLDGVRRVELGAALLSTLPWDRQSEVDRLAPSHLEVPSGSRIALDYSDPTAPVLPARLQELFGMAETPRIGGGRVPLTIHLLSPARRPVQVTRDLASFWADGYFQVRKELRGRYPKHYWPDDPLTAEATRRTRPRDG